MIDVVLSLTNKEDLTIINTFGNVQNADIRTASQVIIFMSLMKIIIADKIRITINYRNK